MRVNLEVNFQTQIKKFAFKKFTVIELATFMYINYFYIKFITFFNPTYVNSRVKFEMSRTTNVIPNKIVTNYNVKTASNGNTLVFWLNIY